MQVEADDAIKMHDIEKLIIFAGCIEDYNN